MNSIYSGLCTHVIFDEGEVQKANQWMCFIRFKSLTSSFYLFASIQIATQRIKLVKIIKFRFPIESHL